MKTRYLVLSFLSLSALASEPPKVQDYPKIAQVKSGCGSLYSENLFNRLSTLEATPYVQFQKMKGELHAYTTKCQEIATKESWQVQYKAEAYPLGQKFNDTYGELRNGKENHELANSLIALWTPTSQIAKTAEQFKLARIASDANNCRKAMDAYEQQEKAALESAWSEYAAACKEPAKKP